MEFTSGALDSTRQRLRMRFGAEVDEWWQQLPTILTTLAARWDVALGEPVDRGNTSLVVRSTTSDGRPAILKITPDRTIARGEAAALESWQPSGRVPELWHHDGDFGALIMEAIPGEATVGERYESLPLGDVAELIDALHRTGAPMVGNGIVTLAHRVEFMFDLWSSTHGTDPGSDAVVSPDLVERGLDLARRLATDATDPVLLHGDLHPWNVLDGGDLRGFVAIDPRPCVGDRAFDAVDWVIWPHDDPANWELRCGELALLLDLDASRVWDWCRTFAAMLAATTAARGGDQRRVEAFLALAP